MKLKNWLQKLLVPQQTQPQVEVREVEKVVTKIETVTTEVPVVKVESVTTEVPVEKLIEVEKQVPIEKLVQVDVQVPVDRIVQVEKEIPVSKVTEVIREIPVDKVQTVTKEIAVDKVHTVDREIPITKVEVHTTEIPVNTVVQVEKQVPVDKLVEVIKEVPVDKVQIIEVEKPVFNKQSVSKLNEIHNQIENVMGLRDLFKSKSNEFNEQYETLSKSINQLHNSVEELNGVDFDKKINTLYHKLDTVNEFLNKVKFRNTLETTNDIVVRELNEVKSKLYVSNIEVDKLKEQVERLTNEKKMLEEKYKGVANAEDIEKLRYYYTELLNFAFRNIGPTTFDPAEARFYWENLVK